MSHYPKKKYSVKKSSGIQSTELLKTLQKAITTLEATVAYVFVNERISNVHTNNLEDMKTKLDALNEKAQASEYS